MRTASGWITGAVLVVGITLLAGPAAARATVDDPPRPFAIHVVDDQTGRGVPLVRLRTTNSVSYYTDSNGLVAYDEPGLMDADVWFTVSSPGYRYDPETFGVRGVKLHTTPGKRAEVKLRRVNVAERLYRLTGQGIYRDTVRLGEKPPIADPLLDAGVMGQDTAQTAIYQGRTFWVFGDTDRPSFPLGNFRTTAATSPENPDPDVGIDLTYFADAKAGFVKPMVSLPHKVDGPVWVDCLMVLDDPAGRPTLLGRYAVVDHAMRPTETGLLRFDDATRQFVRQSVFPPNAAAGPNDHPLRAVVNGTEYFYFPRPYPTVRVPATWADVTDTNRYEAYTCLRPGSAYDKAAPPLNRGPAGKLLWTWQRNARPTTPEQVDQMVAAELINRDETPFQLREAGTGKAIRNHHATVYWNAFRKRWVMILVQAGGASNLGEAWYAEANAPQGPWREAVKVATHAQKNDDNDFYNPLQHPTLAKSGGRVIYFEGTYVNTFSGNPNPTPWYNYNQLMYRLDLADPRLKLPDPPPGDDVKPSAIGP